MNNTKNTGLVYVFTGEGKGKTSASLGVAIRALAAGMKVAVIQWYKDPAWRISEHNINSLLTTEARKRFAIHPMGMGFKLPQPSVALSNGQRVIDKATETEHFQAAQRALDKAKELLNQVDVLILDEVNNAVSDALISPNSLLSLISHRGNTHLILTGRNEHQDVVKVADLVTNMTKVKHPYDLGKLAVKGLDF